MAVRKELYRAHNNRIYQYSNKGSLIKSEKIDNYKFMIT